MTDFVAPSRLRLDGNALAANWRALAERSGAAACGAAVKADAYGLGAVQVVDRLARAGCRDFFVATWGEALALTGAEVALSVFHGVRDEDMAYAQLPNTRPVLSTRAQVARWKAANGGQCDVMVDTGMNRLGIALQDVADGLLDELQVDVLMSHLACAETRSPMNARQRDDFAALQGRTNARRLSLANSAGIALGADYHFDLTRPGLSLYGGVPCAALDGAIRQVAYPEAQVIQRRAVRKGATIGYNAIWTAPAKTEVALVNLGYADGYWRGFSDTGSARANDRTLPVLGRVSMDLTALDCSAARDLAEGDWVTFDYALPAAAEASGMSQYELLTGLGARCSRVWRD